MKRYLYYFTDRLQISRSERRLVLILSIVLFLTTTIQFALSIWGSPKVSGVDSDAYEAYFAVLEERTTAVQKRAEELQLQYFPVTASLANQTTESSAPATEAIAHASDTSNDSKLQKQNEETYSDDRSASADTSNPVSVSEKININTAGVDELVKLPGIGPAIAARIVEYRAENGRFQRIEDIKNVRGIGPSRFEAIKDMIKVGEN
ncbi:MAG: helix-hairpin-helix domain-containing protein [Balneolales bacterium]|nr:helix-hairpin-helix domain-containing protein [Balneolales bacterium]